MDDNSSRKAYLSLPGKKIERPSTKRFPQKKKTVAHCPFPCESSKPIIVQ